MKKILFLLLIAMPAICFSQSDSTKKPFDQYCMLVATQKFMSSKVTVSVDFGQETKLFHWNDGRIKDELGNVVNFNSVVDALNYMSSRGWVFVNAYALTYGESSKVLNYLLRKPGN